MGKGKKSPAGTITVALSTPIGKGGEEIDEITFKTPRFGELRRAQDRAKGELDMLRCLMEECSQVRGAWLDQLALEDFEPVTEALLSLLPEKFRDELGGSDDEDDPREPAE